MDMFTPPTPTDRLYANDPETGEPHYRLTVNEMVFMIIGLVLFYVAHTMAVAAISIWIYTNHQKKMETKQKTVYIAGPITNIPHGNVTAFADATRAVRNMGHIAKNPHEFCADIPRNAPWATFVRRGLQQLMDCTDIILLPGWESSDGASLEHMNAFIVDITIHDSIEAFGQQHVNERVEVALNGNG